MSIERGTDRGRVWLLEDSPLEAEMARRALSSTQDVETFNDGSAFLERIATVVPPDAVILDWQLPGVSGVEVTRVLRAQRDAMTLPILMLTAQGQKEDVVEALAAGANDYVTKPYDVTELVARVGTLVRTSRLNATQLRRSRQLALAADIGAALTAGGTREHVARRCVDVIASHLDARAASLWTRRDGALRVAACVPSGEPLPDALIERVIADRKPFATDNPAELARIGRDDVQGFVALPLVVRDEIIGVVALGLGQPAAAQNVPTVTIADLLALGMARSQYEEERATLLESERTARADAEAANRSKDDFLAMVSHELRTPLNAITGWTAMLRTGSLDESRTKRALETIERNARAQAQLIEDLLDISRIVSGKLRLDVSDVDVAPVADLAVESARVAADAKGVAVDVAIDPRAGHVTGDADRIQQVILNLLSNAIKFTPREGRVGVRVQPDEHGIGISVSDTGQGISPEFLPYVFERFKQADGTMTRAKGGLGLGLAIVRHLVELHGGTVAAHSDGVGKGATFTVHLPSAGGDPVAPSSRPSLRPAPEYPRAIEGLRVLVVDDDPDAREYLTALLQSCKIDVRCAPSAAEAFTAIRARCPDVVLSDIAMPDEDGLSLIRRVRRLAREEGGRVPAIALTAHARLEDRRRALGAGFNGHLAKPVDPAELLATLSSFAPAR